MTIQEVLVTEHPPSHASQSGVYRMTRSIAEPGVPTRIIMSAALVAVTIWAVLGSPFVLLIGQTAAVYAVAALGQWLLFGRAGQFAISGAAFMALGAFTAGLLAGTPFEPFPIPLVVSAVVGLLVGLISGLPGIRFRGLYLLLASVALQYIVSSGAKNYQLSNAPGGLAIPPLHIGSLDLSAGRSLFFALLIILAVVILGIVALDRTGVGLAWRALRESEVAAAVGGVDATRWKLYAFATSGAITAMAGCMFAYLVGIADYGTYGINLSITLLTMTFVGGVRSLAGTLVGAVVITALPYVLQQHASNWLGSIGFSAGWYMNNVSQVNAGLFSLIFLLVVLFSPRGIEGLLFKLELAARRQLRRRDRAAEVTT